MKHPRPVVPTFVSCDPEIIEFLCAEFACESPESLLIRLEELMQSGEYTQSDILIIIRDIQS